MEASDYFQVGMKAEQTFIVREEETAGHIGSGSLRVLATPSLIGYMERVARKFIDEKLPGGMSSVGIRVEVSHLAATPVGAKVRVRCEVVGLEGRRVDFAVEAWDELEKVGEGRHQRFVINENRFMKRLEEKLSKTGTS
jgi:fluoroacetyl-CoA thioesterase